MNCNSKILILLTISFFTLASIGSYELAVYVQSKDLNISPPCSHIPLLQNFTLTETHGYHISYSYKQLQVRQLCPSIDLNTALYFNDVLIARTNGEFFSNDMEILDCSGNVLYTIKGEFLYDNSSLIAFIVTTDDFNHYTVEYLHSTKSAEVDHLTFNIKGATSDTFPIPLILFTTKRLSRMDECNEFFIGLGWALVALFGALLIAFVITCRYRYRDVFFSVAE